MERLLLSFQFCAQNIMNNSVLKLGHFKGQKTDLAQVACSVTKILFSAVGEGTC